MAEKIAEFISKLLGNGPLCTVLISMIPVIESRLSIPLAVHTFGMSPLAATLYALLGGALVTAPVLALLRPVFAWLKGTKAFCGMVNALERRFTRQSGKIEGDISARKKNPDAAFWKFVSVAFFVATPLPGSGVWGGAAVAVFLEMKPLPAFFAVTLGNVAAALLVLGVTVLF